MKFVIPALLILLVFLGCTEDLEEYASESNDNAYELLFTYDQNHESYVKKHLITYFTSIAIGSEFGNQTSILKKWIKPMKIFIEGNPSEELMVELKNIITEINALSTDSFKIVIAADSSQSNFNIYFGNHFDYTVKHPSLNQMIQDNKGLFTISFDGQFKIQNGHMFVDIERSLIKEQKHILREELTQALGLGNDIMYYPKSIFYDKPSRIVQYSDLDKEVIRLLYHPSLIPGLGKDNVENILQNLLGIN